MYEYLNSIKGLLLQGAVFDGKKLIDAECDGPELEVAPLVTVAYLPFSDAEKYASSASLKIPVYYSTTRERLLTELSIPGGDDLPRWILAGVALFLSEDAEMQQSSSSKLSENKSN